jgi:hypothetical protein
MVGAAGEYLLVMPDGQRLSVSRPYRRRVRALWRGATPVGRP